MSAEPIDLDAVQALADAATPGPWEWDHDEGTSWNGMGGPAADDYVLWANGMHTEGWINANAADAEFIAQARTLVPALIAELREARATIERIKALAYDPDSVDMYTMNAIVVDATVLQNVLAGRDS